MSDVTATDAPQFPPAPAVENPGWVVMYKPELDNPTAEDVAERRAYSQQPRATFEQVYAPNGWVEVRSDTGEAVNAAEVVAPAAAVPPTPPPVPPAPEPKAPRGGAGGGEV